MGKRGPQPTPTKLKLLRGNPGHRPINTDEPQPPAAIDPVCPKWLMPAAKQEWKRVVPLLQQLGLVTDIDLTALAGYCQCFARWRQAEMIVKKLGLTYEGPSGPKLRPEVHMMQRERLMLRAFASEFGFSPASRSRVKVDPPVEKDPFEDFINGNRNQK
jgi:P27 family predicted phage terminase small subunit